MRGELLVGLMEEHMKTLMDSLKRGQMEGQMERMMDWTDKGRYGGIDGKTDKRTD